MHLYSITLQGTIVLYFVLVASQVTITGFSTRQAALIDARDCSAHGSTIETDDDAVRRVLVLNVRSGQNRAMRCDHKQNDMSAADESRPTLIQQCVATSTSFGMNANCKRCSEDVVSN